MARVEIPPVLSQIRSARTYAEQASALRALKDETVGHIQRKEWWIQNGILEPLVALLQNNVRSHTRASGKERSNPGQPVPLAEDDVVRLLALQLLASFAYGGAAFLGPLHAVGVVPAIMPALFPADNTPQIVLTALRTFTNLTASAQLAPPGADDTTGLLSDALFSPRFLEASCAILSQDSTDAAVQEQKRLVASLVTRLCQGPSHQNALADSGVLDALATMLASFVVARGEVVPGAEVLGQTDGLADLIPHPAPPGADLAVVLEALATIVANSRFRSCLLLCSPAIMAVFAPVDFAPAAAGTRAAWHALETSGFGNIRPRNPGAMDYLLPAVPVPQSRSQWRGFDDYPPLGFSMSHDNLAATGRPSAFFKFTGVNAARLEGPGEDEEADAPESPLIPWLIHLVRSTDGLKRVMAASLLTSLFKAGFASPEREQALAVLVVPLLCQLMKENDKEVPPSVLQSAFVETDVARRWAIQERAPDVLARLVGESETLQQAAHDCGTIKMVIKLLKTSYDPQPVQTPSRPWSPTPERGADAEERLPNSCRVGPPGQIPAYSHRIRMRESALKLLAAMATLSNDYREALAAADVVPYIVESLSPTPGNPKAAKETAAENGAGEGDKASGPSPYGHNPNLVIMAACHATRALSRLPSIVRTALQDHGAALPIYKLLKHSDAEVQIAASSAVINLVTNCSPLVEPLLEAGIVKTLCEHAHSLNPGLRLNALWALKHLIANLDTTLRKQCLEELEPGWLVQLISDDADSDETTSTHPRSRSARRAAAATATTDFDDDEDMDTETLYDDDAPGPWTWPATTRTTTTFPLTSPRMQQAQSKLTALRDAEFNPARRSRADSLAIQEQGLGFIRNLIMLPHAPSQTDMVDYLFSSLGQDRLFGILADKLKVRVVGAFARRASRGRDTLVLYPQARVVENLAYVLVHMAAGAPRHRQLVVAQTELLKLLGGHFASKDAGVRKALCQLFMNLSCLESDGDRLPCSQRAMELERLGFLAQLEGLEQGDVDLDVRERAKAAVAQMKTPTV